MAPSKQNLRQVPPKAYQIEYYEGMDFRSVKPHSHVNYEFYLFLEGDAHMDSLWRQDDQIPWLQLVKLPIHVHVSIPFQKEVKLIVDMAVGLDTVEIQTLIVFDLIRLGEHLSEITLGWGH